VNHSVSGNIIDFHMSATKHLSFKQEINETEVGADRYRSNTYDALNREISDNGDIGGKDCNAWYLLIYLSRNLDQETAK